MDFRDRLPAAGWKFKGPADLFRTPFPLQQDEAGPRPRQHGP